MGVPMTTISICSNVRLDPRYNHSIYFASLSDQAAYFAGKVVKTFSAYSYVRKNWRIKVDATLESALHWNYLYFRNGSGKTFYYFIKDIQYISDTTVELDIEMDVLQTYLFDFELLPCFVERQHVTDDTRGLHTVDEGLELGALVDNKTIDWANIEELAIMILASINPNYADTGTPIPVMSGMYNGVFSGLKVWAVAPNKWGAWGSKLDDLATAGFLDGILAMWMYPKSLITLGGEQTWDDDVLCKVVSSFVANGVTGSFDACPTSLNGYTPKNKKLLTYPFNFLYCSNNAGASAVYKYELFEDVPQFKLYGSIGADAGVTISPIHYNGVDFNYEEGFQLGGYPSCAWDSDVFKMWLAQNQNQHKLATTAAGVKIAAGAVTGLASAATGNLAGVGAGVATAYSGAMQIGEMLAQKKDMEIQPPQARGNFSSNVNVAAGKQTFTFYYKSVGAEHAKMIDDYFTMYGYRINRVQKPNIHARSSHTYVKTVGCLINGDMCTDDMVRIENIFDHGITWWTNGDKIGDYTQSNATL